MRRWPVAWLLLGALVLVSRGAAAQLFGQWSWDGVLGLDNRSYRTEVDGRTQTDYRERSLRLDFGLNGFVIHPSIARFRLGLDTTASNYAGTAAPDSKRWGLDFRLNLFPTGRFPSQLFAAVTRYDYVLDADDPLATTGLADAISTWGARIRLRGGILRGLTAGTEHASTSFVDPDVRDEIFLRQYLDWAGASGRISHHHRLERDYRRYGRTRFSTDDYTLTVDEHGLLSDSWRWDLSGIGFRRTVGFEDVADTVDTARLRSRFVYTTRRKDLLDLSYTGGLSRTGTAGSIVTNGVTARYIWQATPELQLTPTAGYTVQSGGDTSVKAPSAGIDFSWNRNSNSFELAVNGGVGAAWIDAGTADGSRRTTNLTWSLGGTAARGTEQTLRTEVDVALTHNELRTVGEAIGELPDLGTGFESLGTQDAARARLTVRRQLGRWRLGAYAERRHREQDRLQLERITFDSDLFDISLSGPRIGFSLDAGTTRGRSDVRQEVRFAAASFQWSPTRLLSLRFSYNQNRNDVAQGPQVDRDRIEGTARMAFGRYALIAQVWDQKETVSESQRTTRGVLLSLSARFGGWLPFVSAPQRRGVIR